MPRSCVPRPCVRHSTYEGRKQELEEFKRRFSDMEKKLEKAKMSQLKLKADLTAAQLSTENLKVALKREKVKSTKLEQLLVEKEMRMEEQDADFRRAELGWQTYVRSAQQYCNYQQSQKEEMAASLKKAKKKMRRMLREKEEQLQNKVVECAKKDDNIEKKAKELVKKERELGEKGAEIKALKKKLLHHADISKQNELHKKMAAALQIALSKKIIERNNADDDEVEKYVDSTRKQLEDIQEELQHYFDLWSATHDELYALQDEVAEKEKEWVDKDEELYHLRRLSSKCHCF